MKNNLCLLVVVLASCSDLLEYSPNQRFDENSPQGVNHQNYEKLMARPSDDTVTIAFIGDSQRFYDEVEKFVKKTNQHTDVDFVLVAGDISDFGLLQELEWVNDRLKKLNIPYFAVIGNHDVVGNGDPTFERFFGPLNYSFTYQGYKFILHNTNGREYIGNEVPDLPWLQQELKESVLFRTIGVSHIPPYDGDFNKKLESEYSQLLKNQPNFLISLHGHQHRYTDGFPYGDGIRYMTSPHFEARHFIKLKLINDTIITEVIAF